MGQLFCVACVLQLSSAELCSLAFEHFTDEHTQEQSTAVFVMATSSSDESTAGKGFQFSLSMDSGSRLSPTRQMCRLCGIYRKDFFCKDCIQNANFYLQTRDSFASYQSRLLETKKAIRQLEEESVPFLKRKQKADYLRCKIRQSKEKNTVLKLLLEENRCQQDANKTYLDKLRINNNRMAGFLPKYRPQLEKLENSVEIKQEDIEKSKVQLHRAQEKLKRLAKLRILQLIEYIFPITKIQPKPLNVSSDLESSEPDMVMQLAEASQTTYISDRWVHCDDSSELQYSIAAPTLPGSGNYCAYNIWVAQNRDAIPGGSSSSVERNPAYSISAALTYTAQLLNVIAYYLDIRLPYKMVYADFCTNMTEQQFARRVARLNANVLYLCFSQNMDLKLLQPTQTLYNIMQLVETEACDLGRFGPMEVDADEAIKLEEKLGQDLQTGEESDSESGDVFPHGWEAVPHVQFSEVAAASMNLQSTQTIGQTQASSITGGLYASATTGLSSLWRGLTGRQ